MGQEGYLELHPNDQKKKARAMLDAALFARISDNQARMNAEVFTRTSENPHGVRPLCMIKAGGEQGNPLTPLQYACFFSEGGARQQLATDLANVGSELHEGKAEA
jgi:hypothetical protein